MKAIKVTAKALKPLKTAAKRLAKGAKASVSKAFRRSPSVLKRALKLAKKRVRDLSKEPLTPKQIAKEVALLKTMRVTVGIHDDKGGAIHKGGTLTLAEIMTVHEFGAPSAGIPKRSWLRDWFDNEHDSLRAQGKQLARLVAKGAITAKVAGARLGVLCVGGIQKRIADGIPPGLAPATSARKGSSKPLIDTGQSRTAISYKVLFGGAP